jgi:hypothetical protein
VLPNLAFFSYWDFKKRIFFSEKVSSGKTNTIGIVLAKVVLFFLIIVTYRMISYKENSPSSQTRSINFSQNNMNKTTLVAFFVAKINALFGFGKDLLHVV